MKKNKLFSILLLIALFLGLMIFVKNYKEDGQEIVPPVIQETTNLGQLVVNEGTSNKLKLTRKMNVVNPNSIQVVATLQPADLIDNTLEWVLSWAASSSENVNDYVTLNVASDTKSATITYKKQFNTQIVLTVSSKLTPSVNATLTLDCYKRTTNFVLDFSFADSENNDFIPTINENQKTIDFSLMTYSDLSEFMICDFNFVSPVQSGTVATTFKKKVMFDLSDALKAKLDNAGIAYDEDVSYEELNYYIDNDIDSLLCSMINITDENRVQIYNILASVSHWFDMTCSIDDMNGTTSVNSFTKTYKLQGFNIANSLSATSITLNKTQYIF